MVETGEEMLTTKMKNVRTGDGEADLWATGTGAGG